MQVRGDLGGICAIVRALTGLRAHAKKETTKAADIRVRAFTSFMRAYTEARDISKFLNRRVPGKARILDPAPVIPSLYRRRKRPRKVGPEAENGQAQG